METLSERSKVNETVVTFLKRTIQLENNDVQFLT